MLKSKLKEIIKEELVKLPSRFGVYCQICGSFSHIKLELISQHSVEYDMNAYLILSCTKCKNNIEEVWEHPDDRE